MSLIFLAPLFLAGLAALAIPVIIHLTHRERKEPVVFPSLMFLQRIPYRTDRRQRIRHWLLFTLRALAVALLVAAFARPLLKGGPLGSPDALAARDVVIALDRSASMGYGERWTRATAAVRDVVAGLGADDRVTLVTFADRARALNQPTGDAPAVLTLLDGVRPDGGRTRYAAGLRLARELLEDSERAREVVLITDFQGSGWDGADAIRLPPGTAFRTVDVGDDPAPNRAVAGVLVDRSVTDGRVRVTVAARITRFGGGEAETVPASLELDGQVVQTVRATLPASGDATVRFPPVPNPDRVLRGRVVLPADRLAADDAYQFLLRPAPAIPVLLVTHPQAAARENLYLAEALGVGQEPAFPLTVRPLNQVRAADLAAARVIVLHGLGVPGGTLGRQLLDAVTAGAGLLVTLGPREAAFPAMLADSLGQPARELTDRLADAGATTGVTDYQHPVFEPFRTARSADLAAARVFRYRGLSPAAGTVLARFDDGTPALVELPWGAGRVLVWGSDLGNRWNDLPLRPVFVPFTQAMIRYLARYAPAPTAWTTGQVVTVADVGGDDGEPLVLETPGGTRERVAADAHVPLEERGFYVIRPRDDRTAPRAVLPVNGDPTEADLARLDPDLLAAAATPLADAAAPVQAGAGLTSLERERRQGLWWYLLLGVLLLLAAETVVAHRARRAA